MKHYKNILSFLVSLMLMFCLIISSVLILFKGTLLNDSFYREIINKNNTLDKIDENINKKINYLLLENNISQNVSDEIITKADIQDVIDKSVSNLLDFSLGKTKEIPAVDVSAFAARLNVNINKFIKDNNIGLTKSTAAVFDEIKKSSNEVLSSELEPLDYNVLSKSETGQKLQKVVAIINNSEMFFGIIVLDIILAVILLVLWRHRVHRGFAWIGYSFIASGLLIAIVAISGLMSKFYENAAVPSVYLKDNIASIIEGCFKNLTIIGISLFIIGILFMIKYWVHLYKRSKREIVDKL